MRGVHKFQPSAPLSASLNNLNGFVLFSLPGSRAQQAYFPPFGALIVYLQSYFFQYEP